MAAPEQTLEALVREELRSPISELVPFDGSGSISIGSVPTARSRPTWADIDFDAETIRVPGTASEVAAPFPQAFLAYGPASPHLIAWCATAPVRNFRKVAATDSDPVALQHFELVPEPLPAEVLGGGISFEVWALRLSGGPARDVLTTDPVNVATKEYVFAVPLDMIGNLARKLTEVYEKQSGATL